MDEATQKQLDEAIAALLEKYILHVKGSEVTRWELKEKLKELFLKFFKK